MGMCRLLIWMSVVANSWCSFHLLAWMMSQQTKKTLNLYIYFFMLGLHWWCHRLRSGLHPPHLHPPHLHPTRTSGTQRMDAMCSRIGLTDSHSCACKIIRRVFPVAWGDWGSTHAGIWHACSGCASLPPPSLKLEEGGRLLRLRRDFAS